MISQELARGKTDLVAMVQQGEDSQSINTHCDCTVSHRIDSCAPHFVHGLTVCV